MTASPTATWLADILGRNAVQEIIDHCKMSAGNEGLTTIEGEMFDLATISLTAILAMQTKQEN